MLIISTKGWDCNSIDIKPTFLQGKAIGQNVYLIPPIEGESKNAVWRLNTRVYGLEGASRNWHLNVKKELTKIGVNTSKYDPAVFHYYVKNELQGVLATHADNFC